MSGRNQNPQTEKIKHTTLFLFQVRNYTTKSKRAFLAVLIDVRGENRDMRQHEFENLYETIKNLMESSDYKKRIERLSLFALVGEKWTIDIRLGRHTGTISPCIELSIPQRAESNIDTTAKRIIVKWSDRRVVIDRKGISFRIGEEVFSRVV